MTGRLRFLLFYSLAWILFFQLARLLFVLYSAPGTAEVPFSETLLSFLYGLRMDIAMVAYILFPVCLLIVAGIWFPEASSVKIITVYSAIVLFPALLLILCDLEVYRSWGFRIDTTPLRFLSTPREVWASVSHLPVFWILLLFLFLYGLLAWVFRKWIHRIHFGQKKPSRKWLSAAIGVLVIAFLLLPARGGWQLIPLNQSSVYFSKFHFANVSAINACWNFMNSLARDRGSAKAYAYLPPERAIEVVDSLYRKGSGDSILFNQSKPNVILLILESFTRKATLARIGNQEVTPRFNTLKRQGIYFSRTYASGDRTDKGLAAILSGYPALNNFSIIHNPARSAQLETLGGMFKELGYKSSFYYGGEPEFANIKSYLLHNRFDRIIDKGDFSARSLNSKWGAHDGEVAKKLLADLAGEKEPFFSTFLTLSSHEPFETPVDDPFRGKDLTTRFMNSLHYTDEVIYQFVEECKKQPWWKNTVLILVADHGHTLIEPSTTLDNFTIPMLWLGGALQKTGYTVDRVVSQVDLAATLESQLAPGRSRFPLSKNLFTSYPWAYFSFHYGFGFVQPGKAFVFDNVGKQLMFHSGPVDQKDLEAGKALQQFTQEDYFSR